MDPQELQEPVPRSHVPLTTLPPGTSRKNLRAISTNTDRNGTADTGDDARDPACPHRGPAPAPSPALLPSVPSAQPELLLGAPGSSVVTQKGGRRPTQSPRPALTRREKRRPSHSGSLSRAPRAREVTMGAAGPLPAGREE